MQLVWPPQEHQVLLLVPMVSLAAGPVGVAAAGGGVVEAAALSGAVFVSD